MKYDDIDMSGKCIAEDSETEVYDIFLKQHKSTDIGDTPAEYANVEPITPSKVHNIFSNSNYIFKIVILS